MHTKLAKRWKTLPLRKHWIVFAALCVAFYAFFAHPDVIETANHGYVLLDSTFKGRFLNFYTDVMAHPFGKNLYYINNAHYNIVVYIIFAVAELPYFIIHRLFQTTLNEPLLYFIGKLVSAVFFVACIPLVRKIARQLGMTAQDADWSALFFALSPPAFFSVMAMGQYDSICLFFMLLGVYYWLQGRLWLCTLWIGVGAACKFFSLLILVPLILLAEKRPLHILKYGATSLWLLAPTSLLFWGRTGDMGGFNDAMVSRLFAAKLPAAADISLFPLLFFALCVAAYLWRPDIQRQKEGGIWLCLATFALLFFFVAWHPQWVILLAPFIVLTTFMQKNRVGFFFTDLALAAGFFLYCALAYPRQLEANMLDYGILGLALNLRTAFMGEWNSISFYLYLIPVVAALPMVLFGGALVCHTVFKLPLRGGSPATKLGAAGAKPELPLPAAVWLVFGAGTAVWLLPTLFTWLKCFSFV